MDSTICSKKCREKRRHEIKTTHKIDEINRVESNFYSVNPQGWVQDTYTQTNLRKFEGEFERNPKGTNIYGRQRRNKIKIKNEYTSKYIVRI